MNFFSKENPDRWHQLAWWLCVITMPWLDVVNSVCLVLLATTIMLDRGTLKRLGKLKTARWAWPFFAYYFLLVIGLSYASDIDYGLITLQKKIAFVGLPVIAIIGKELTYSTIGFLKRSFVYSCSLVVFLSLVAAAINFLSGGAVHNFDIDAINKYNALHPNASPSWMHFSYIQLLQWIDLHPAYFSMYLVFCLVILFTEKYESRKLLIFHLVIGVAISAFIALLSSRMAIAAFIVSVVFLGVKKVAETKLAGFFALVSSIAVVVLFIWLNPVAQYRLIEEPLTSTYQADTSVTRWNSVTYRLLEWQGSWSIIRANPVLGVGTSGWKSAMDNFYSNYNSSTVGLTYNSHNQFLQTWMENGMLGLISFLLCVFASLFRANIDPDYVAFIFIFSLMCLTESIIERQKGIVFFTLFQSLFLAFENKNR